MKSPFYIAITILLFVGCSEKTSSNLVIGNWWYIQSDSTYSEAYVNENEWDNLIGYLGPIPYTYVLEGDSLIFYSYDKTSQRKWRVNKKNDSTLFLSGSQETIQLNRINFNLSYFDALEDSLLYEKFKQEFILRYLKYNTEFGIE
ncbi:hypothetical protein [Algoriphagus marinus]|uniref:hypothetical protein n=1 Tax=Algoriphagus marinus TaxID=1925762 RepID=UPI00094BA17D|nr:hypothetical protein [Algoriphagus marinus]